MSLLIDALREKYRSPAEVMRALGLPTAILGYDAGRPRRARDEEPEPEHEGDPAEQLFAFLKGKLSPAELERVAELLGALSSGEEGEEEEERADNDNRPGMKDHDDYEEDEEPNEPNFKRSRSLDMPQPGKTAMDAVAKVAFDQRFPNAKRIDTAPMFVMSPDRPASLPAKTQSAAARESFFNRFPALKRVA